jgi:hypothetical protein
MADQQTTGVPGSGGDSKLHLIPDALKELPEPITPRPGKRRKLRGIGEIRYSLTDEQQAGFDDMFRFIEDPDLMYYLLEGYAGTGKTTLITAFSEAYIQSNKYYDIAVTATTNKAVVVLADKADFVSFNVIYKTIHSLLHLKQKIDDYGNIFFDVNGNGRLPDRLHVIVIDEASMIDRKLHDIIMERASGVKIIFVGDFYQIPPVKERGALIALPRVQKELNMQKFLLDKVVRQAAGNPIIQLATYVREHEHQLVLGFDYKTHITGDGSIILLDRTNKPSVFATIKHLIANDHFKNNPDYAKVIVWRNATANRMNHIIRRMIYADAAKESLILPGEKLLAYAPIIDVLSRNIIFSTNSEFEVISCDILNKVINKTELKYFRIEVVQRVIDTHTFEIVSHFEVIDVLHPDSQKAFDGLVKPIKEQAIRWSGTDKGKQLWRFYYSTLENFADVRYNYALTAHKSQGSTFRNAIVLEKDIRANPTMPERNRLLYVAYTRPATNLIIVR